MDAILTVRALRSGYGHADVLEDVNITVQRGTITCLLGANGAGKSTLIRSILGLCRASHGQVVFEGRNITSERTHKLAALGLGCIPEGRKVFPKLTVEENLRLGSFSKGNREVVSKGLTKAFAMFPRLQRYRHSFAGSLSGGEQAMVSIARGLMSEPKLLLIDEPSLGLSPRLIQETFEVIQGIRRAGVTVFLVEQNVRQTLNISDRGYILARGTIAGSGTSADLVGDPEVCRAYFGQV
jgi:branched-chain amino acid transport system ATP-binding protein